MGNSIQVFGLGRVAQFEHAYVVIAGHQESIMGARLHVHWEGAMFWHPPVNTAGEFQHHGLKASMFLDIPHLNHLYEEYNSFITGIEMSSTTVISTFRL